MTYERDVHLIQSGADDKLMENASPVGGKQKPDSDQRRQRTAVVGLIPATEPSSINEVAVYDLK